MAHVRLRINVDSDENNRGGIYPLLQAGTRMEGSVTLEVRQPTPGKALSFGIRGTEHVTIGDRKAERECLCERIHLNYRRCREIRPGLYTFPFAKVLPSSIPASKKYGSLFSIEYILIAKFDDIQLKKNVRVSSAFLPTTPIPYMATPATCKVKRLGGIVGAGTLSYGAHVKNNRMSRNEPLEISIACRNDSTVNIARVEVKLEQVIDCTLFAHATTSSKTADWKEQQKSNLATINNVELPDIMKTKLKQRRDYYNNHHHQQEIYDDLQSGRQSVAGITIPDSACDSYKGGLIQISHCLKITFVTQAAGDNPSIEIPIYIGNRPAEAIAAPLFEIQQEEEPQEEIVQREIPMIAATPVSVVDRDAVVVPATATVLANGDDGGCVRTMLHAVAF